MRVYIKRTDGRTTVIEIVQMIIGRVFDVDDILLNLIGAILGFYIYRVIRILGEKYPALKKEWFLNIVAILALIGLFMLLI